MNSNSEPIPYIRENTEAETNSLENSPYFESKLSTALTELVSSSLFPPPLSRTSFSSTSETKSLKSNYTSSSVSISNSLLLRL